MFTSSNNGNQLKTDKVKQLSYKSKSYHCLDEKGTSEIDVYMDATSAQNVFTLEERTGIPGWLRFFQSKIFEIEAKMVFQSRFQWPKNHLAFELVSFTLRSGVPQPGFSRAYACKNYECLTVCPPSPDTTLAYVLNGYTACPLCTPFQIHPHYLKKISKYSEHSFLYSLVLRLISK